MAARPRSRSPRGVLPDDCRNKRFEALEEDHFLHIEDAELNRTVDLKAKLGDVKFVLMGGPQDRAESWAKRLSEIFGYPVQQMGTRERYALFKVGPMMAISHGIGMPSMMIVLHELTKVLHYAGCTDVTYLRIGTSGGIGVTPGTLVVASHGVNTSLECKYETTILGKNKSYDTVFDSKLCDELAATAKRMGFPVVVAKTMSTNDYYEEQARLDGAVEPGYTEEEKFEYLRKVYDCGVRNMEMEATALAAFCARTGVRAGLICAALLDRLKGDQTQKQASAQELGEWNARTTEVVLEWLQGQVEKKKQGA